MQAIHRQRGCQFQVVIQCTEVGSHQHLGAGGGGQHRIGVFKGGTRFRAEVLHQRRLIQLHPLRASVMQLAQQLHVHRQQRIQQLQRRAAVDGLGQQQEGHRPDQHRAGFDTQRLGLAVFGQRLVAAQREALAGLQFGHQVVVVGVEPFGHFQRVQVEAIALQPAGHGEVAGQRIGIGQRAVAGRDGIEQEGGIQHLVVQAEVVAGRHIHPGIALQLPMRGAQGGGGVLQCFGAALAGPVRFQCALELALGADTGKTQVGNSGHGTCPHCSSGIEERRNCAAPTPLLPCPPRQRPSPPRANRMP